MKDLRGPVSLPGGKEAIIFDYTDAYSVFDWGRMPDALTHKGQALAILAADFFEKLENPETWKIFSRTPEALALRKGNRYGSAFNELGERLQAEGLRTHYLGALAQSGSVSPVKLSAAEKSFQQILVQRVQVEKPKWGTVLGRTIPDYSYLANVPLPRLVPLEVVFRFSCPPGSSLVDRIKKDPDYPASRGFAEHKIEKGKSWGFPFLETFSKLEPTDRLVSLHEALPMSGLKPEQLQEVMFLSAWTAGYLRSAFAAAGLDLADGKFEWALGADGKLILVDAVGPDELRILKNGVQLSKEFLRHHYRKSSWYAGLDGAKAQATAKAMSDWKRFVEQGPAPLPAPLKELASQIYMSLANRLTGKNWFSQAWPLEEVCTKLEEASK